ncbi:MAG: hypothetical protein HY094_05015 [Candidatus Melainabacteria bacterium]|nr:hypothetical protein [Candidatus Melainabacteria bacterium]
MKVTKNKLAIILAPILIFGIFTYGYTQYLKKGLASIVLLHEINLQNPPESIFAISTFDQSLPDGKNIPKGTRFIGMLIKENSNYVIYFNEIQSINGTKMGFLAKSNLNIKESGQNGGVSAKISKTLYKQTKTNVLGAIFNTSNENQSSPGLVLPRGSSLKIEIN